MVTSTLDFISIGCNCIGESIDWGKNGIVAYGAHHFVALMLPEKPEVIATLKGHKDRVNHVKWIPNTIKKDCKFIDHEDELVSVSSDHSIIIWKRNNNNSTTFEISEILKLHIDSVTSCSVLRFDDGSLMMTSTSTDNTVKIWRRAAIVDSTQPLPKWEMIQSIEFKPRMMTCCSMGFIPGTKVPMLALGGVESKIHLFIQDERKGEQPSTASAIPFRKVVSLQGHQDWIRCLSFRYIPQNNELFLASSSQDNKIRLWKVSQKLDQKNQQQQEGEDNNNNNDVMSSLTASLSGVTSLSTKAHIFNVGSESTKVMVSLESVLSGHEDWVYTIAWYPSKSEEFQDMCIVSASMDKTMMVWRPDRSTGIWMDEVRVGDMGGNILGLYGAQFSPDGQYLLSHGYNGAFHLWQSESAGENSTRTNWSPRIITSGHFGPVQDLMWSPDYNYFISSSSDRTLRLYSPWRKEENTKSPKWYEIARPQIHGYDLECFTFVHGKNHVIVSGAEEKILRVFIGSQNFVDTLSNIARVKYANDGQLRPIAANQPSLGLSNKPFFADGTQGENADAVAEMVGTGEDNEGLGENGYEEPIPFNPEVLSSPPFEEHLLQSSLWPEVQKLYGHGNEIIAVASSLDGKYVASTCRASSADQATVRIWNVADWCEVANLKGHTLTVVQLAFSHDNRYLLGVSRDRMWSLWKRTDDQTNPYVRVAALPKAHGRIVWGCSWSYDDSLFATGSRDKLVKIWGLDNSSTTPDQWKCVATLPTFTNGVNAVEFAPKHPDNPNILLLAVGEEDGTISIWQTDKSTTPNQWTKVHTIDHSLSHVAEVRRIRWNTINQIATCSTDQSVRLFTINY